MELELDQKSADKSQGAKGGRLNPLVSLCGRIFSPYQHGPKDEHGCILPENHKGNHIFNDQRGIEWAWEYDMDCGCEDCCGESWDGHCLLYWKTNDQAHPQPGAAVVERKKDKL